MPKSELNFPPNNLLQIECCRQKRFVLQKEKILYACAAKCPHAGGIIADGFIDVLKMWFVRCTDINSVYKMEEM